MVQIGFGEGDLPGQFIVFDGVGVGQHSGGNFKSLVAHLGLSRCLSRVMPPVCPAWACAAARMFWMRTPKSTKPVTKAGMVALGVSGRHNCIRAAKLISMGYISLYHLWHAIPEVDSGAASISSCRVCFLPP